MNKVITINLNGVAYQLEEGGFDALRTYLDAAGRSLDGNPDRDEILADIEQAIGDKFRSLLGASKTVIVSNEVAEIIAGMGPVEDASASSQSPRQESGPTSGSSTSSGAAATSASSAQTPKRLYKIREGAKISGVCTGIAAYLNIDVTIVRVAFLLLAFGYGSGMLLYFLLMLILPEATTPDEVASAHGTPAATAKEFIRRAREGYYEGMRSFGSKRAHREWKRKFKNDMRGWKRDFQNDMHRSANRWRDQWSPAPASPGSWYAHSFLRLLLGLLTLACVCSIISLVTTGSVFGLYLPGVPVWLGIILVIAVVKILKWPLRAMIGPYCWRGNWYPHPSPFGFLCQAALWVVVIFVIIRLTGGHAASLHEIGQQLPPKLHHAAMSVKEWWDQQ